MLARGGVEAGRQERDASLQPCPLSAQKAVFCWGLGGRFGSLGKVGVSSLCSAGLAWLWILGVSLPLPLTHGAGLYCNQ